MTYSITGANYES